MVEASDEIYDWIESLSREPTPALRQLWADYKAGIASGRIISDIPPQNAVALIRSLGADNAKLRYILGRYVREVPLGHQPHMLAHLAEEALEQKPHKWADPADYTRATSQGER